MTLDFGPGIFTGGNCWLDIAVQTNGGTSFSGLAPRQPVLPVPYAIFSTGASNVLGPVAAAQVSGASTNQVTFTNINNTFGGTFNGTFSGNGASISNLNGSQITFGTVADARLSTNVALLNTNQTFTGTNTFTGNNLFTGSNTFTGNNQFTGTNFYSGVNIFTNRGNSFVGSFFVDEVAEVVERTHYAAEPAGRAIARRGAVADRGSPGALRCRGKRHSPRPSVARARAGRGTR